MSDHHVLHSLVNKSVYFLLSAVKVSPDLMDGNFTNKKEFELIVLRIITKNRQTPYVTQTKFAVNSKALYERDVFWI